MITSTVRDVICMLFLLVTVPRLILAQAPCDGKQLQQQTEKCFTDQGLEPLLDGLQSVEAICSDKSRYKASFTCIEKALADCYKTGGLEEQSIREPADYNAAIDYLCDHQQDLNLTCFKNSLLDSLGCTEEAERSIRRSERYQNLTLTQQACLNKRITRNCQSRAPCDISSLQVLVNIQDIIFSKCFTQDDDIDYLLCSTGAQGTSVCAVREGVRMPDSLAELLPICSVKEAYIRARTCMETQEATCARVLKTKSELTPATDINRPLSYLCGRKAELNETCLAREYETYDTCFRLGHLQTGLSIAEQRCRSYNQTIDCSNELMACGDKTVKIMRNFFLLTAQSFGCPVSTEGLEDENSGQLVTSSITILLSLVLMAYVSPLLTDEWL